ncbi:jg22026 [Pararge aegeria aegeria]|uniref:Jg22026 protein n=1 Tax=Pararge aegeria aegeria TaxID=348720 RepID=A0A8S4RIA2_9NEOP|nr:jg22026 [Pararge aegeria aegeria]
MQDHGHDPESGRDVNKSSYALAPSPPAAACWKDCAAPGLHRSHTVCPPLRSSCVRRGHAVCTERVLYPADVVA